MSLKLEAFLILHQLLQQLRTYHTNPLEATIQIVMKKVIKNNLLITTEVSFNININRHIKETILILTTKNQFLKVNLSHIIRIVTKKEIFIPFPISIIQENIHLIIKISMNHCILIFQKTLINLTINNPILGVSRVIHLSPTNRIILNPIQNPFRRTLNFHKLRNTYLHIKRTLHRIFLIKIMVKNSNFFTGVINPTVLT
jgi:hypothetical protein